VDNAEIMKSDTRRRLTNSLRAHEQKTTNQVAVLTVPTIHGESVENAPCVFEQWKLGRKGNDNGALVVVVPQDRRMRIEVGYGLEGTLTDAAAGRVIRDVMTPRFRQGDYDDGILQGVGAVLAQLEGRAAASADSPPQSRPRQSEFLKAPRMALHEKVLMGAFIFGIIGLFTFIGIVTPGMGWFLYFFLIPFWAMFPVMIFGSGTTFFILLAYLIGFPVAKLLVSHTPRYRQAADDLKKKGYATIRSCRRRRWQRLELWGGSWARAGGLSTAWATAHRAAGDEHRSSAAIYQFVNLGFFWCTEKVRKSSVSSRKRCGRRKAPVVKRFVDFARRELRACRVLSQLAYGQRTFQPQRENP
jgi:uncharacterized protein